MRQPASRRHDDEVGPFRQGLFFLGKLLSCASSVNRQTCDARVVAKPFCRLVNLHRQFPRRDHNQGLHLPVVGCVHDSVHGRQQERRRFAGSCLGNAQDVLLLQGMGNRLPLNGRGLFKPHGFQSVFDVWVQVQGVKSHPLLGDRFVPLLVGIHTTKVGQRPRATFRQTLLFMGWACIFDSSLSCRCHDSFACGGATSSDPFSGLCFCRFLRHGPEPRTSWVEK